MKVLILMLSLVLGGIAVDSSEASNLGEPHESYRLGPNDTLRIQVYGEEDLSLETKIEGDGQITYPLLGILHVEGLTVHELQQDLTTRLAAGYLNKPKVTVTVARHRNVYVSGEVKAPGAFPYEEGLTVQKAITMAGGFTERASRTDLRVERHHDRNVELVDGEGTATVLPDDVIVVARAQRFYVNGEVKKPGDFGYERGLTLHMAITMAGGFTEKASKAPKVLRIVNGEEQSLELSLDAPILPDDIIVVTQRFF